MEGLASRLILGAGLSSPSPNPTAKFLLLKTHNHIQHLQRSSLTTSITIKTHQHFIPIRSLHTQFNKTCFAFSRFRSNRQPSKEDEEEEEEKQDKIGKTGLFVTWVVLIMVGLQWRFCRPALAAWYWPFGTTKTTSEEIYDLIVDYKKKRLADPIKVKKLLEREDKLIKQEEKRLLKEWEEKSLGQKYEEELAEVDPQVVESKTKEITKLLIESFPELESAVEEIEEVMKDIVPYLGPLDLKMVVDNIPKLWVYLMVKSGEFNLAVRILDILIERDPSSVEWPRLRELVVNYGSRKELEADRPEEARMYFEELLEKEPFNPRLLQGLATAMHKLGEDAAMIQILNERLQLAKKARNDADVYKMKLVLANTYTLQGNFEEALNQYQCLIDEDPEDYRSYLAQGIIYTVLERFPEAEQQFRKYMRVVPPGATDKNLVRNVMLEAFVEGRELFEKKKEEEQEPQ